MWLNDFVRLKRKKILGEERMWLIWGFETVVPRKGLMIKKVNFVPLLMKESHLKIKQLLIWEKVLIKATELMPPKLPVPVKMMISQYLGIFFWQFWCCSSNLVLCFVSATLLAMQHFNLNLSSTSRNLDDSLNLKPASAQPNFSVFS